MDKRTRKRIQRILSSGLKHIATPVLSLTATIVAVRGVGMASWGSFVFYMALIQLLAHLTAWGNQGYLTRAFSRKPAELVSAWQDQLLSRLLLLVPLLLLLLLSPLPRDVVFLLAAWLSVEYFFRSFNAVLVFDRAFVFAFVLELLHFVTFLGLFLALDAGAGPRQLIQCFLGAGTVRLLVVCLRYRSRLLDRIHGRISPAILHQCLWFAVPGFIGLVQSRTDLYCVIAFLSKEQAGAYGVVSNLVIQMQSVAILVLAPFLKNIYRVRRATLQRLTRISWLSAFGLPLIMVPAAACLLVLLFHIDLSVFAYVLIYFYVAPFFVYLIGIHQLMRVDRQRRVALVTLLGLLLNLILNLLLVPRLGLIGALISGTSSQWALVLLFALAQRRLRGDHDAND